MSGPITPSPGSPQEGAQQHSARGSVWYVPVTAVLLACVVGVALACTLVVWAYYPDWWQLIGYFWYSIPGNSFLHLPQDLAVVYAGTQYSPWMVALVGALGAVVADGVDYFAIKKVFGLKKVAPVKDSAIYKAAVRCFYWRPWITVLLFCLAPLPYDIIRVLAPSSGYPFKRYASASFLGRTCRFYLLAMAGAALTFPPAYLIPVALLVLLLPLGMYLWNRIGKYRARTAAQAGVP